MEKNDWSIFETNFKLSHSPHTMIERQKAFLDISSNKKKKKSHTTKEQIMSSRKQGAIFDTNFL